MHRIRALRRRRIVFFVCSQPLASVTPVTAGMEYGTAQTVSLQSHVHMTTPGRNTPKDSLRHTGSRDTRILQVGPKEAKLLSQGPGESIVDMQICAGTCLWVRHDVNECVQKKGRRSFPMANGLVLSWCIWPSFFFASLESIFGLARPLRLQLLGNKRPRPIHLTEHIISLTFNK